MPRRSATIRLLGAVGLALLASPSAIPQTPNPPAPATPPTSEHLQDMESEMLNLRAESEQLGGSGSPARSLDSVQTRLNEMDQTIERTEEVFREVGGNLEDLAQLQQQVQDSSIVTGADVRGEGVEETVTRGVGYCLKRACMLGAEKALGWVALAGDVVSYGGKVIIRQVNVERIHDLVERQMINHTDIFNLLGQLRCQQAEDREKVRRLRELRERENFLAEQIALERQRLTERQRAAERARRASRGANRTRETDYPGDLEEWNKLQQELQRRRNTVSQARTTQGAMNLSPFAREVLAVHNGERARFGADPLNWSSALEGSATAYAQELARTGRRVHASRAGRGIARENINQGMLHWNTGQMVQNWVKERGKFTPGTFPNVCAGDWSQCGHYTQMIWPTTTEIGCGMASGSGFKWLVCRYSPGGNKPGQPVGTPGPVAGPGRIAMLARRPC